MKNIDNLMEKKETMFVDFSKKETINKELNYCLEIFKKKYEKIYNYQLDYFCWLNTRKDILNSMKSNSLDNKELIEVLNFCDERNSFLITKLKALHSYISFVEESLSNFKSINDFVDIDSIDTKLRLMLISLGMDLPTDVFKEAL